MVYLYNGPYLWIEYRGLGVKINATLSVMGTTNIIENRTSVYYISIKGHLEDLAIDVYLFLLCLNHARPV